MNLIKTLSSPSRNPTIDIFRAAAILLVVLFHFNHTIYMGSLGVDLFFVISGFLVSGLLFNTYDSGRPINFFRFFIKRGFKIWPSYYFFLIAAGILGYMLFRDTNPEYIPNTWLKYVFFYLNYTVNLNENLEWIYGHAWSLCVEEHFYIILPVVFILNQKYGNKRTLLYSILSLIVLGNVSKILTFCFTESQDTYFLTHNRIDCLAWGVLLQYLVRNTSWLQKFKYKVLSFLVLIVLFYGLIKIYFLSPLFFQKVVFRGLVPVFFAAMIASVYYIDMKFLKPLRIIGYYSYNWYLWHVIISVLVANEYGYTTQGLIVYLAISFAVAIFITTMIEEPFLNLRNKIYQRKQRIRRSITKAESLTY